MTRASLIRRIYDGTPRDYRLRSRGAHKVMLGERSGHRGLTTLETLSTAELERLADRYHPARDRRRSRRDCVGIHTHDSAIGAERRSSRDPKRNVRWHEDRQERADATARRYAYRAKRLIDQAFELQREARELSKKVRTRKKAAALEEKSQKLFAQAKVLLERADRIRPSGVKYGRAKTKIGTYDSEGGRGWVDRDASRVRRRRRLLRRRR